MMLSHPVVALAWETWRLSRRWYLWVLMVAFAFGFGVMTYVPRIAPESDLPYRLMISVPIYMMVFGLCCLTALLAMAVGSREGFPYVFEFRLPVNTLLLVAVPMLCVSLLCASLFFLPLLTVKLVYDIPYTLIAPTALVATEAALVAAAAWSSGNRGVRGPLVFAVLFLALFLFGWLDPVNIDRGPRGVPNTVSGIIALDPVQYGALAVVYLVSLGLAIVCVGRQRRGNTLDWSLSTFNLDSRAMPAPVGATTRWSWKGMLSRCIDALAPSCPQGSPTLAEIWVEVRRFSIPVILFSVAWALLVPLGFLLGRESGEEGYYVIASNAWGSVFLVGIGMSLINRRKEYAGMMNVFEGTRPLTTGHLAAIQVLVIAVSTGLGILLVETSQWLSMPMATDVWERQFLLTDFLAGLFTGGVLQGLTMVVTLVAAYLGAIMLFTNLHSGSILWGRKFLFAILLLVFYVINKTFRIVAGIATLEEISNLFWGVVVFVAFSSVYALWQVIRLRLISGRMNGFLAIAWTGYLACALAALDSLGLGMAGMEPARRALALALLILPLALQLLTLQFYDRLRHT